MDVDLLRHSLTAGNLAHRYVGRTDEPLCAEGLARIRQLGCFPEVGQVTVSPLRRVRETAALLFPQARQIIRPDLREMDFGDFEGRTATEMMQDPAYIAWVDSGCRISCPNGESLAEFSRRTCLAFDEAIRDALQQVEKHLVLVAHGGTIMAVMHRFARPRQNEFAWQVKPLQGYKALLSETGWLTSPELTWYRKLEVFSL